MNIESSRVLGILAACFTLLGAISTVTTMVRILLPSSTVFNSFALGLTGIVGLFSIVGFILFFIAMFGFSRIYDENKIFYYPLWGIVILIAGCIFTFIILFALLFSNFSGLPHESSPSIIQSQLASFIQSFMPPILIVVGSLGLVNGLLNFWAFNLLAAKSGVPLFKTGAKVLLFGQLLGIVILVVVAFTFSFSVASLSDSVIFGLPGGILNYVAWAIFIVAYFRIKPVNYSANEVDIPSKGA